MDRATISWLATAVLASACGARSELDVAQVAEPGAGGTATASTASSVGPGPGPGPGGGGNGGSPPDNPIISQSPSSLLEAEAHLAVGSNGFIAAAWIAVDPIGLPYVAYVFSTDDGDSWTAPQAVTPPLPVSTADPVVAVGPMDDFYLTYIAYDAAQPQPDESQVFVARAPSGQTSFGAPVVASPPGMLRFFDKPWIIATANGDVIVSFGELTTTQYAMYVARSTSAAQSFTSTAVELDTTQSMAWNFGFPCAPPTSGGSVWLTYHQFDAQGVRVMLRWSSDAGATWPAANRTIVSVEPDTSIHDSNCVADGNQVFIAYSTTMESMPDSSFTQKLTALRIAHSIDGGATIASRADAHDPAVVPFAMIPNLARDDASGTLHLVYYTGTGDEDPIGTFRKSQTTAFGITFSPSQVVQQPIVFEQSRQDVDWLGDYVGVVARQGTLYTVFTDNSLGFSHVRFHRAPIQ